MARPVSGSSERDLIFEKLVSVAVAVVVVDAREPSDLALTRRSDAGIKFCRLPPRILCKTKIHILISLDLNSEYLSYKQ